MITTINGVGVKFSHVAKCPSTKIHVRMPMVDPSVSALITAALMGNTIDPKARNISSMVVVTRTTSISGALANKAWMLSCSRAGTADPDGQPLGRGNRPELVDLLGGIVAVDQAVLDHPHR